jgi:signal transduction histidine kinase
VVSVDPQNLPLNHRAPPVIIEEVLADDRLLPMPKDGLVQVGPGRPRIEIRYTALSLLAPERVRFRVKFDGLDNDWVDTHSRRIVHYSHVPPGRYQFRVVACNNDGVWNETGAVLSLIVRPHFWETSWFVALVIMALAAIAYAIYHRRVSQLEHQRLVQQQFSKRLLEVQESERKRIAQELHDGLGQNLMLVKNRAVMGRERLADPEKAATQLNEISAAASLALQEVRQIAYSLRPFELDRLGLTKAIAVMLERVAATAPIRFDTQVDDLSDALAEDAQIHLYRVIQESINNILKHSAAASVIVEVQRDPESIRIVIHDDGKGFDPKTLDYATAGSRGLGLTGIGERVRVLGGQWDIQSAPGKGTRLNITIPAAPRPVSP